MTWIWKQAAGELWRGEQLVAKGYSGAPAHKNVTASEGIKDIGPIPRGRWRMVSVFVQHSHLGRYAIRLDPVGHDALGRSEFLIHADSITKPGCASRGCIILPLETRMALAANVGRADGVDLIEVV